MTALNCSTRSLWDEVWDEYDSRVAARGAGTIAARGAGTIAARGAGTIAAGGAGTIAAGGAGTIAAGGAGTIAAGGAGIIAAGGAQDIAAHAAANGASAAMGWPVHGQPQGPAVQPAPAPLTMADTPALRIAPRATGLARLLHWPRGWGLRRAALALTALVGLYLISPIASAVQFAAAVQRADPGTLTNHVDWSLLRPGIEARLAEISGTRLRGPHPVFLAEMQQSLADHLASPEGLARALAYHLPPGGSTSFGQLMREARPVSARLWQVSLAPPNAPNQVVRLTLRLAEPWSLEWSVVAVELPGPLGPTP